MSQTKQTKFSENNPDIFEYIILVLFSILISPFWIINFLISYFKNENIFEYTSNSTIDGHIISLRHFQFGYFRQTFISWEIIIRHINLFGSPINSGIITNDRDVPPGIISLWKLRNLTGLSECDIGACINMQKQFNRYNKFKLLIKFSIASLIYTSSNHPQPKYFSLFGIQIHNISMKSAIQSIVNTNDRSKIKIGYFVNVNSFNMAISNPKVKNLINKASWVFADGSGVRLAAKYKGISLRDNINGTDMLPLLCKAAVKSDKSIFLLGAKPDIARLTAKNLIAEFPNLRIAGTHHGHFDQDQNNQVIKYINQSNADILLVGMGSPIQEQWLYKYSKEINCSAALAVGGLFDFFSGRIPRAPIWMRELGIEWIWRLVQEPKSKFHRYVIGNPLFLYRLTINH